MGFNKAKAVRAAEKYLAQGKITNAIGEYSRIVAEDANDFNALNMLGDLYSRTNDQVNATASFTRVAEHYRVQGFALKAIAIYKKICRLNPASLDAATALAELYSGQGLIVEARTQYLNIADAYTREGKTRPALDVLRRIADLDPANAEVRLRVAESYAREHLHEDAIEAYTEAGERFLDRRNPEAALDAFNHALNLRREDVRALQGFVNAHAALDSADEAAEILEELIAQSAAQPVHESEAGGLSAVTELRLLLLRAYLAAENPIAAERAIHVLVSSNASDAANATNAASVKLFLEVARLYMRVGDTDSAVRALGHALEPMLTEREDVVLLEVLSEALARNPEHVEALKFSARIYTWQHDEGKLRQTLERLVEATETIGDEDEERRALTQLLSLGMAEPRYIERLQTLGGNFGLIDVASEMNVDVAALARTAHVADANEVPTFENFMLSDAPAPPAQEISNPAEKVSDADYYSSSNEFDFAALDANNIAANVSANETQEAVAPVVHDSSASFADLNDEVSDASFPQANKSTDAAFDFSKGDEHAIKHDADRVTALLNQEIESVDFYLAQGYEDVAHDTLDMLERQYGAHEQIESRRRRLKVSSDEAAASSDENSSSHDFELMEFNSATIHKTLTANEPEELDFSLPLKGKNDAAPAATSPVPEAQNSNGFDAGLSAIFEEFKSAIEEQEPVSTADYETHYNLGIAYQEMDLLDEAIEEFQKAANLAPAGDGTPRYLQCCNMLGHCFMSKRLYPLAVMWFRKGIDTPGHTEDEYQALRYELGSVYEKMGDVDSATDTFMQVYGMDVSYRGVAERLRELRNKSIVTM